MTLPDADKVLRWVRIAKERGGYVKVRPDELREIELCALSVRDATRFLELYAKDEK